MFSITLRKFIFSILINIFLFLFLMIAIQNSPKKSKVNLLFSQIIEALYCYEEGVLNSISEANIGSIYGWGFPLPGIFEFINKYGIKNLSLIHI